MNKLTIIKSDGGTYIDSREVAEIIGKRHDNLLSTIGNYRRILAQGGLLKIKESDFFVESTYLNSQNKVMPCYLITKRGAEVIANKLTGERGILFTFAYVSRFNEMEAAERKAELKAYVMPPLSEVNAAVRNVMNGMADALVSPECVMDFLRGIYKPLGIRVSEDGGTRCFYTATDIARFHRICSESGRPHARAVAAIISKLNIHGSHMEAVPYGLVGVTFRYDAEVVDAVKDWIIKNGYPGEIPHLGFYYHIYYNRQLTLFDNDAIDFDDEIDFDDLDDYDLDDLINRSDY
jgi:Rha family phage regulatory protein